MEPGSIVVDFAVVTDPVNLRAGEEALCEIALTWVNGDGSEHCAIHNSALSLRILKSTGRALPSAILTVLMLLPTKRIS